MSKNCSKPLPNPRRPVKPDCDLKPQSPDWRGPERALIWRAAISAVFSRVHREIDEQVAARIKHKSIVAAKRSRNLAAGMRANNKIAHSL